MAPSNLKLPPHLRVVEPRPETPGQPALEPVVAARQDQVTITTPLGSVTCPPGRLRLNLLQGGMPKLPGAGPLAPDPDSGQSD